MNLAITVGRCPGFLRRSQVHRARASPPALSGARTFPHTPTRGYRIRSPHCKAAAGAGESLPADEGEVPRTSSSATGDAEGPTLLELLRFILPTAAIWLVSPIMSLVDTAVVGAGSAVELAALAPGTVLCDHTSYFFSFLAIAVTNLVATAMAQGKYKEAGDTLSDGLAIAASLGVAFSIGLILLSPSYLERVAAAKSQELIQPALTYVNLRIAAMPAVLVTQVAQAFYLACKSPILPLIATLSAGALNLVGDLLLCNVFGMGIAGAAIATAVSQFAACAMLLVYLKHPIQHRASPYYGVQVPWEWRVPSAANLWRFLGIAGPVATTLACKVASYTYLGSLATSVGTIPAAAHQIAFSVFLFFNTLGDAVGQLSQSFMPGVIGVPRKAWALARQCFCCSLIIAALNAAMSGAALTVQPTAFTSSPAVLAEIAPVVPYVMSALVLSATSLLAESLLFAVRDLRFLVLSYCFNLITIWVAPAIALHYGLGLPAVWWGIIQLQSVRLLLNGARLLSPSSLLNKSTPLDAA